MLSYTVGYQLSRRKSQGEMHMLYMYHEKTLAIADFQRPNSRKKVPNYISIRVFCSNNIRVFSKSLCTLQIIMDFLESTCIKKLLPI